MPIFFACPCGKQIRARDGSSGRVFTCSACGRELEVPPVDAVDLGIDTGGPTPLTSSVAVSTSPAPPSAPIAVPAVPCEFEYKMAQLPPNIQIREGVPHHRLAANYLEEVVNRYALAGWEFYRVDAIGITEQPGCLGSMLGRGTSTMSYYVATFRRPRTP